MLERAQRTYPLEDMDNPASFFKRIFNLESRKRMICIEAIVEKRNGDGSVVVRPLLKNAYFENGKRMYIDRSSYTVPVYSIHRGGYTINIPLFVGDTGYLFACDRPSFTAREKNAIRLSEPQTKKDGSGEIDYKKNNGNKGSQNCDLGEQYSFVNGFFLPCSFSAGINNSPYLDINVGSTEWSIREDNIYKNGEPFTSGMNLISGSNSNIVFTEIKDGPNKGKTMIDVYYK